MNTKRVVNPPQPVNWNRRRSTDIVGARKCMCTTHNNLTTPDKQSVELNRSGNLSQNGCGVLLLLLLLRIFQCVYVHSTKVMNWQGEPSTTKNSSSSRAQKTGAQLRDNPEEREKWRKMRQKPLHRHHNQYAWKSSHSLLHNKMSMNSGDERD